MKARDIIPGWPRGRSTSRQLAFQKLWNICLGYGGTCCADCVSDRADDLAEERRKADMMEARYLQQRMDARGKLYPQPLSERLFEGLCLLPELQLNREVVTYMQMFHEVMEDASGARFAELTRTLSWPKIEFEVESFRWQYGEVRSGVSWICLGSKRIVVSVDKPTQNCGGEHDGQCDWKRTIALNGMGCGCCPGGKHQW